MKKLFKNSICALLFACALVLASCTAENQQIDVSAKELSDAIFESFEFPAMYNVPTDELMAEFAVSGENFSDVSAFTTEEPYGIERVFFGIVKKDADNATAKAQLENYFQLIKNQSANYDPVEFAKAEDAYVFEKGNLICLVICEDSAKALETVKEIINK